jgi:hypothetical protein
MISNSEEKTGQSGAAARLPEPTSYARVLLVWMALLVALNGVRWLGGFPAGGVAVGVEQGVARAEAEAQTQGERTEEQIRKVIRTQRETISFWTALAAIDDFLIEPILLAGRAVLVATLFTGLAAVSGRTVQYDQALTESARIQGVWVLGLALRVALLLGLRRPESDVDTSLALLLPAGGHSAITWITLRQLDVFALVGWAALAVSGWRRGDASLAAALALCGGLGLVEISARTASGLLLGAAIRLTLMVK